MDLAPKVSLYQIVLVYDFPDAIEVVLREVTDFGVRVYLCGRRNLHGGGQAHTVYCGQRNIESLFVRDIHARYSWHNILRINSYRPS